MAIILNLLFSVAIMAGLCSSVISASLHKVILEEEPNCMESCTLSVINANETYFDFFQKIDITAVKVVYFKIYKDNARLSNTSNYIYGWARAVTGEPIFSLPMDYISACLFLPLIFYEQQEINITESTYGCLDNVNDTCRSHIILETLSKFTRINKCHQLECDTLCRRRFNPIDLLPFHDDEYSCCESNYFHNNTINLESCLKTNHRPIFLVLNFIISVISAIAVIPLFIFIARRFIRWQGR